MRPKPSRVSAFKNCFGTIWSVSTLTRSSGATFPLWVMNGFIPSSNKDPTLLLEAGTLLHRRHVHLPHIHKMPRQRRRSRHHWTYQMRPAVLPLASLEIPVGGACAALVRREHIGIHPDAHAASRVAPLESRLAENPVESFLFRRRFDAAGARHNQRLLHAACHVLARYQMR